MLSQTSLPIRSLFVTRVLSQRPVGSTGVIDLIATCRVRRVSDSKCWDGFDTFGNDCGFFLNAGVTGGVPNYQWTYSNLNFSTNTATAYAWLTGQTYQISHA